MLTGGGGKDTDSLTLDWGGFSQVHCVDKYPVVDGFDDWHNSSALIVCRVWRLRDLRQKSKFIL